MNGAHLRLEAVRVEGSWPVAVTDWGDATPRRAALAVSLDRRVASVHGGADAEALLGYVVLPWCDVTLRCVAPGGEGGGAAGEGWPEAPSPEGSCAHAWMRVELDHIDDALAYVERLPVEQGLVSKPWRWRWSSAAWHCGFGAKPLALAPEWSGPVRRDLWRERLAGAFVGRSDRSVPVERATRPACGMSPGFVGSAVGRLVQRAAGHSPGMPSAALSGSDAIEPSHGELAVA